MTAVDVKAKLLAFQNGDKLTYDKLIVATGARVSVPCHLAVAKANGTDIRVYISDHGMHGCPVVTVKTAYVCLCSLTAFVWAVVSVPDVVR